MDEQLHILVLADRDWTHPQGGETAAGLQAQVSRWLAWGHQVTVVACRYSGAAREERIGGAQIVRVGGRSTVFPRVILRGFRGRFRDADVVLEVVNGATFLTPLWLRRPGAVLVYRLGGGQRGKLAALLLETLPLRFLYPGARFLAGSDATAEELRELGPERIDIVPGPSRQGAETDGDQAARATLDALREERATEAEPLTVGQSLRSSGTGKAAGLAIAQMGANVMALLFTIVFARILGADGYGSLAALLSTFLILSVPGSAMQVLVAREVSGRVASGDDAPAHGMHRWLGHVVIGTALATIAAVLLREPLAHAIGIPDLPWAAALTVPAAGMWLLASIERGALQGLHRYKLVGWSVIAEATGRLAFGLMFVAGGLDVTGSFAGTGAALLAVSIFLFFPLEHELRREPDSSQPDRRLRDLLLTGLISVVALGLIQLLQNLDVLIVKHQDSESVASAYAAAAVAAKAAIWVSVGLGWYLLPEAARRTALGEDARPVLVRALGLVSIVAVPMVLVYAVAAEPLLDAVFKLPGASGALPWLGLAMSALACTYLAVQYLLALRRWPFLLLLAAASVAEIALLPGVASDLTEFALVLFAIQAVLAVAVGLLSFRFAGARRPAGAEELEVELPV